MSGIIITNEGDENSTEFRVYALEKSGFSSVSMWHDVKLFPFKNARDKKIINMITEIPKCSRKKYEIATNEPGNPIKQDIKKGKLREFLKGDVYFNYGCIPRTWEDPDVCHPDAQAKGDNDPLDICEIGLRILKLAEITAVKVLGVLCLIDEGEADWKVIAISIDDPWAVILNDVDDVEKYLPGTISAIREWFRTYKTYDGSEPNRFALDERCMNAEYAMGIIDETHHAWLNLVSGKKESRDKCITSDADNDLLLSLMKSSISDQNAESSQINNRNGGVKMTDSLPAPPLSLAAAIEELNQESKLTRNSDYLPPDNGDDLSNPAGLKKNKLSYPRLSSDDLTKLVSEGI